MKCFVSSVRRAGLVFGACLLSASISVVQAQIAFEDATASAGDFGGGESWGASWGFMDGDIHPDLFVSNHRLPPKIFGNNGDGTFTDITESVDVEGYWLANPHRDTHSGSWADINNDGFQDLILPVGGPNSETQFFINDAGVLRERSVEYGVPLQASGRLGLFFDYDGDGLLDVLVTSRVAPQLLRNSPSGFSDVTAAMGLECFRSDFAVLSDLLLGDGAVDDGRMEIMCVWQAVFPTALYGLPGLPYNDEPLTDHTAELAAQFSSANLTKDVAIVDLDNDLRPDVFALPVGNFRPSDGQQVGTQGAEAYFNPSANQSLTFRTLGEVDFVLSSSTADLQQVRIGAGGFHPDSFEFSLDPSDPLVQGIVPHGDDDFGIAIGYDADAGVWTLAHNLADDRTHLNLQSTAPVSDVVFSGKKPSDFARRPRLFMNTPDGFVDTAVAAGFGPLDCVTVGAGDFDNDGYVDLYLGCRGGVENIPNRLFRNQGDGSFVEVPNAGGAAGVVGFKIADGAGQTESVVVADYDLDGHLDLFVTNGLALMPHTGGPYQMFRNLGHPTNHWIQIDLVGVTVNRDAIGARVIARAASLPDQLREHNGGYHRYSQNLNRVHFGLGDNPVVDLEVLWPNGTTEYHYAVAANTLYRITEGGLIEDLLGNAGPAPVIGIDSTSVLENAGVATLTLTLSEAVNDAAVWVDYATADGSATAGLDYVAVSGSIEIPAGQTSASVEITILDDALAEGDETFTVTLSNPQNAALASAAVATVTIIDDDVSACGAPDYSRATESGVFVWRDCESAGPTAFYEFRVTGGGSAEQLVYGGSVTADAVLSAEPFWLQPNDILDTLPGDAVVDFALHVRDNQQDGFRLAVPPGARACFRGDSLPAGVQVYVGAARQPLGPTFDLGSLGPCDEGAPGTLSVADLSVSEAAGTVDVTVALSEPAGTGSVFVDFATADGTALAGLDYVATSGTLEIPAGQSTGVIPITILNDNLVEGDEQFTLTLSNALGAALGHAVAVVTILDTDQPGCGMPVFDRATERGLFLWRDCDALGPDSVWEGRVTGGGDPALFVYEGEFVSPAVLSAERVWLQNNDLLDAVPGDGVVDYALRVKDAQQDGFRLTVPAGASVCVDAQTLPADAAVYVGAGRLVVSGPFDLGSLEACTPGQ